MFLVFTGWTETTFAAFLAVISVGFAKVQQFECYFWGLAALLAASVMLGPVLHVVNQPATGFILLPFRVLQSAPAFGANRLPGGCDHLLMLALAILTGAGAFASLKRYKSLNLLFALVPAPFLVEHVRVPINLSDLTARAVYDKIAAKADDFPSSTCR